MFPGGLNMRDKYMITIVPEGSGSVHKLEIKRKSLRFLIAGSIVFLLFFGYLFKTMLSAKNYLTEVQAMKEELSVLKEVNSKYQKTTENLEERLIFFTDKTQKLASYVGITVNLEDDNLGIGGLDYLNDNYSEYLTQDLESMNVKAEKIFEGYLKLENIYKNKNDILRGTPSIWPTKGMRTDGYGWRIDPFTGGKAFHKGTDIAAKRGTPVIAAADGFVVKADKMKGLGNFITISHKGNITTTFAHLQDILVKKGQKVKRGDLIGTVGNSGRSTGPHLHFEIHQDKKALNPEEFIIHRLTKF